MRKRFQWTTVALAVVLVASMLAPAPATAEFPENTYVWGNWAGNQFDVPFFWDSNFDCLRIRETNICSQLFGCSEFEVRQNETDTRVTWVAPKFSGGWWLGIGTLEVNVGVSERRGFGSGHSAVAYARDKFFVPAVNRYGMNFIGIGDRAWCSLFL